MPAAPATAAAAAATAAAALSAGCFEPGSFLTAQQVCCDMQPGAATAALQLPLLAASPPQAAAAGVFPAGLSSAGDLSGITVPAAAAHVQGYSAHAAAPLLLPALPMAMPQQQQQQQQQHSERECYRSLAAQLATMEASLKTLESTLTAAMATSAT
jgi:hypothetical protein